jgi:hypothetical protein
MPRPRKRLIRSFDAGHDVDLFLAAGASTVLILRLLLHLMSYPQVGGPTLHIAHLLWGGLLMTFALLLLFTYTGPGIHQWAAFSGGIGFGLFIDEIGKFITRDNDYFYRPAVALIYASFVVVYVVMRTLRRRDVSSEEYLVNALIEAKNVAVNDLDDSERLRALQYLKKSGADTPLVRALSEVLTAATVLPQARPHPFSLIRAALVRAYKRIVTRPAFPTVLVIFFVAQLVVRVAYVFTVVHLPPWTSTLGRGVPSIERRVHGFDYLDWLQLGSTALGALFVALGVFEIRQSRFNALRMFQRSVLISIFLTQTFVFYRSQWAALPTLVFNLMLLVALNFAINQEAATAQFRSDHESVEASQPIKSAV